MECKYCEKNNNCAIKKSFTEEEIGCSEGVLTIKAQKELNAFQIIKEKRVNLEPIKELKNLTLKDYNRLWVDYHYNILTKEEFELLKEVFL